jgi:hypothetical protein
MSPTEFAVRMLAADERFAHALKHDDIREMRAALAEKTGVLAAYFAAPRDCAHDEKDAPHSRAATDPDWTPSPSMNRGVSAPVGALGSRSDAR